MARQATVKKAPIQQENLSSERVPPGRATEAGRKKGPKRRVFDYSRWRLSLNKSEDFAAYLAGYPDTTGLMAYVYRLSPKINFGLVGREENNILETHNFAEMTPEFILSRFGRGKYMINLNDANRPKGQTDVCRTWFKLEDEDKPPVYDIRTLVLGHPENVDEVNRQIAAGALLRDASGAPRIRTDADGAPVLSPPPSGTGDLVSREIMGQVLLKLITQGVQSPGEQMKQSIEIAKLLAPPSAPAGPVAPVYSTEQIAELVAAKLAANGGSNDPFTGWERMERFLEKAGAGRGPGQAPVANGAPTMSAMGEIAELLKGAAQVIPMVLQGLDYLRRNRGAANVVPIDRPAAAHNGNGNGAHQLPLAALPDRIAEVAQLGFLKMKEGIKGWDFAAYVCIHHPGGLEVYKFLEPNGPAGVLGLAVMNPATAAIVSDAATRSQLEAFLVDFFDYDPEGNAGEQADESQTSPAVPTQGA